MKSEVDDWLSELPPLDGADDEPAAEDGLNEELPDSEEDASLDDATADDLEVDDGVDFADDEPSSTDDDERWEADVGEPELDFADDAKDEGAEGDVPGVGESDLDLADDLPPSADDAGEEGTTDAIEQALDEELPALDADDEGDFEDALLLETGLMFTPPEGPRWSAERWERVPSADRTLALAVPDDDAVAAIAMCAAPDLVVSVTVAGRLLVDGDAVASRAGRRLPTALAPGKAGPPVLGLARAGASTVVWAANRTGRLARSDDLGRTWSPPVDVAKSILALAVGEGGSVVVLAEHVGTIEILTSSTGLEWDIRPALVEGRPLELGSAASAWLAVGGSSLAIGDASRVWIGQKGTDLRLVATSAVAGAGVFAGQGDDAPFVFVEAGTEADESMRLFRAARDGRVEVLAEIAAPEDDRTDTPTVFAMAWDELSPSLRVAFATMVCTVAPRAKS